MSDQQLLTFLKTLGYSNSAITSIMAGAESAEQAEAIRAAADRRGMTQLTPVQACAGNPQKLRLWVQTAGMIRHLSANKYTPREDQPIDVVELDSAIRGASPEQRIACKGALSQLGLIK